MAQEELVQVAVDLQTEVEGAAKAMREADRATTTSTMSHHAMVREIRRHPSQAPLTQPTPMPDASTVESRFATTFLVLVLAMTVILLLALSWSGA